MIDSVRARDRAVRRVILTTLALNVTVAAAKLGAGAWFHVLALTADGLHSMLDALNGVVGLAVLAAATRPPDAGHPYGHRKFETFATLAIGISLGAAGVAVAREALVGQAAHATLSWAAVAVVAATLAVSLAMTRWEARRARALGSNFLAADAEHLRGDLLVTAGVVSSLGAIALNLRFVDILAALAIAAFIGWNGWRIIAANVSVLADAAGVDAATVSAIAVAVEGVRGCHCVRSRGLAGHVFVDLHLEVDPEMATTRAHALAHMVAWSVRAAIPDVSDVVVHVEPEGTRAAGCAGDGS